MSYSLIALLAMTSVVLAQTTNCVLEVPNNALTAEGLATPYKMSGCNQIIFATEACFVEAAILDPATGDIQIYNPLVINKDQAVEGKDFIAPVVPTLPPNAVVGIFFGSNAVTLTLTGDTNTCVNGDGNSVFGQFAYCNSPAFFTAASEAVSKGLLKIPPPGNTTKASTVQPCPVTRDFRMVDMDQSDNVDSTYLLINNKTLAQNTPANAKKYANATEINNGSDNLLLNAFLAPTLGCTPFTAPSITTPSGFASAMALNELQSQFFIPEGGPALVPLDDDFTVISAGNNVAQSLTKTNLYRAGVGQPPAADAANASAITYCQRYAASGIFIALNEKLFSGATSPAPAASNNLFTFLANRFATSFGPVPALGCQTIFGLDTSPVTQTTVDCIVTAAKINTKVLQDILDGKIQPSNSTSTSTISASSAVSSTTSMKATKATKVTKATDATKDIDTTKATDSTKGTDATKAITSSSVATSTAAASALATTSSISTTSTTTVLVEVVSFFVFVLSLGGAIPGVTGNDGEFLVLEEVFVDLQSAASAACTHQFNSCASFAGSAFSGTDCLNQMNSCNGAAATASTTANTPATLTATATVPAMNTNNAATTTLANAGGPAGGNSGNSCPTVPALIVSSCTASTTVTVTAAAGVVSGFVSGFASPSLGLHRHLHNRARAAEPQSKDSPDVIPHWKARAPEPQSDDSTGIIPHWKARAAEPDRATHWRA